MTTIRPLPTLQVLAAKELVSEGLLKSEVGTVNFQTACSKNMQGTKVQKASLFALSRMQYETIAVQPLWLDASKEYKEMVLDAAEFVLNCAGEDVESVPLKLKAFQNLKLGIKDEEIDLTRRERYQMLASTLVYSALTTDHPDSTTILILGYYYEMDRSAFLKRFPSEYFKRTDIFIPLLKARGSEIHSDAKDGAFSKLVGDLSAKRFFEGINLQDKVLDGLNLQSLCLAESNFMNASMRNVNLSSADLSYADMRYANASGANFDRATLFDTRTDGMELANAENWNTAIITTVIYDPNTNETIYANPNDTPADGMELANAENWTTAIITTVIDDPDPNETIYASPVDRG